ncbi:glycine--tRNA ligase subunit beta [Novosphingobium sp. Gsoil 351]|nr:glycine--tRNA ligase subunit beta [Novosphingobium sp. Gsoil 351]QGN56247.1 glycine--tRNA ligase subunit beta [Novosphingobium sp. Gsoil 351]
MVGVSDFLLELRMEEIPARMQAGARAALEKAFREHMTAGGVTHGAITVWSTPRRLALIARGLPEATEAQREEIKGPRVGAPPQALEGFLRKVGQPQEKLEDRGGTYFAIVERPGRATRDVLAWAIAAIVRTFAWPKAMRWGAASLSTESPRWVRPLSGIVAILGEELVECTAAGIASGYATLGHRFHAPGPITIGGASDYQEKLRACHVIVDHAEREGLIRDKAKAAAAQAGLALVEDEGLVIENSGLTEWPVPLLGRFDAGFLEVPPEVIQLTARTNQKYFVCNDADGKLANAFVCTANIEAADGGAGIVDGNRKVLAARLSDARFFWEQDRKKSLAQHAEKLASIVFHEKLGTVADKVERVAKLARWLVEEGIVGGEDRARLADLAEQAARLCKADLVTEMVGEFPELQGLMGGYYARAEGLPDAAADAIRDHYKPVGQGDDVPTAPVTVAVSLADKLDTLVGFFLVNERPTGSKDPFALRRAALGIIQIIVANGLRIPIWIAAAAHASLGRNPDTLSIKNSSSAWGHRTRSKYVAVHGHPDSSDFAKQIISGSDGLVDFFADRLKFQQREAGVRHDLIDAVFALGGEDDLVRLLARVHALQAFVGTADGTNLLAGYKRAANILKKERYQDGENSILSYTPETAERALIEALDAAEPEARDAVAAEDFAGAMGALASLRGPIDAFFDTVTVNDDDPAKRTHRLALLDRFRGAVHRVADFSKIEG